MGDQHASTDHRVTDSRIRDGASRHPFRWVGLLITDIMLWEVILWHHYLFADKPRCCGGFRKRQTCIAIVTSVAVIIGYLIWLYWKFEMLDATFWHLFMYLLPVQIVAGCAIVFFHRYRRFGGSG